MKKANWVNEWLRRNEPVVQARLGILKVLAVDFADEMAVASRDGATLQEISGEVGMSVGTVHKWVNQAQERRRLLEMEEVLIDLAHDEATG